MSLEELETCASNKIQKESILMLIKGNKELMKLSVIWSEVKYQKILYVHDEMTQGLQIMCCKVNVDSTKVHNKLC